jgi:hypothetical protein
MCAFTQHLTRKRGGINVLTTPYGKVATELPVGLTQSCLARMLWDAIMISAFLEFLERRNYS